MRFEVRIRVKHYLLLCLAAMLLLTGCGPGRNSFRIEGRLRHMNQGEFLVYSPDGGINGIDTIKVREGRFAYETVLRDKATFVIIFPNFSELAVFGEPGEIAEIKGDASHMKEITVKGIDDNEDMTKIRMEINRLTPPEIPNVVELAKMLLELQSENSQLIELDKQLKSLQGVTLTQLPKFSAKDVKGRQVSESDLKAKVNVVTAWASWNYQSTDIQRRLKEKKKKYGDKLAIVSICLDGSPADCKRAVVDRDSLKWPTVCDGRMWATPLLSKFGVSDLPANVIADNKGRIVARNLSAQKLDEKIEQLLKDEK